MSSLGHKTIRQLDDKVNEVLGLERGFWGGVTLDPPSLVATFAHFRRCVEHMDAAIDELQRSQRRSHDG